MKTIALLVLPLLASCAALDIDAVRLGANVSDIRATAHTETSSGQRTTSRADADREGVKLELVNVIDRDTEVGLLFGFGQGDIGEVSYETYNIGATMRQFAGTGSIRPYLEGRIGYGYGELTDPVQLGETSTDLLNLGAGLGIEFAASERFAVFVQGDIDYGFTNDDFSTQGPGITVGGVVRF